MAVIQTLDGLVDISPQVPTQSLATRYLSLYGRSTDYATLYRTQPNVRTCVDFLARNIAQIGLHTFRRLSDTDRERLSDHPFARLINRPNPYTTAYRLMNGLVSDMAIYDAAFWVKIRRDPLWVYQVPPPYMVVSGRFIPQKYTLALSPAERVDLDPSEVVHFRGYNPTEPSFGLSPLETLRRVLAEEWAAGEYREQFWANAARMGGIIERPESAPDWSTEARERFMAEFKSLYAGPTSSGETAVLEDGMTWKAASFSAQDSQYLEARKLTREECARAYQIPLPMVGILDHATFSNISEQHKNLYQDCLAPWLAMIEQELELQLLPEFPSTNIYIEFNINEKMRGSFEEQASAFSTLVGRPVMTANEGRARLNLPKIEGGDADLLVTPLNVLAGGLASPTDTAPPPKAVPLESMISKSMTPEVKGYDPEYPRIRLQHVKKWTQVLTRFFNRQRETVLSIVPAKSAKAVYTLDEIFARARWDRELAQELFTLSMYTAGEFAKRVADNYGIEFDPAELDEYYRKNARFAAEGINNVTASALFRAVAQAEFRDEISHVFDVATEARAPQISRTKVTQTANNGSQRAAHRAQVKQKTWVVNSGNPRSQHEAMNGERVNLSDRFSNGMLWPGDPSAPVGAEEVANCQCSCEFD